MVGECSDKTSEIQFFFLAILLNVYNNYWGVLGGCWELNPGLEGSKCKPHIHSLLLVHVNEGAQTYVRMRVESLYMRKAGIKPRAMYLVF